MRFRDGATVKKHDDAQSANEARRVSVGGSILDTWGDGAGSIVFAEWVDRPEEFGGGKLALIGYSPTETGPYRKTLCAYEGGGNLDVPLWTKRVEMEDILPHLREGRGYVCEDFQLATGLPHLRPQREAVPPSLA